MDLYYSDSSYQTVENTLENKGNYGIVETLNPVNIIAGIGESTATGINQIEDTFYDAFTLNDGINNNYDNRDKKGFIKTSDAEALGKKISAKVKATTAGWTSFTTDAGETKDAGDVTTYDERYQAILEGDKKNDKMRTDSDTVDRANNLTDENVEGVKEVTQALTDQAGNTDKDAIVYNSDTLNENAANAKGLATENKVGINTNKTDISNVYDYVATVAHENSDFEQHQRGETGEALTTISGNETADQWVRQNFTEGRETGGKNGTSVEQWREQNKNSETFTNNNATVGVLRPDEVTYWSPKAHDKIFESTFGEYLSKEDIDLLKKSSRDFDTGDSDLGNTQTPDRSYMHSMSNGDKKQSKEEAVAQMEEFVRDIIQEARRLANSGDKEAALIKLGQAMHPIMDKSSPAHSDEHGDPKTWNGMFSVGAIDHIPFEPLGKETEHDLTLKILRSQKKELLDVYNEVFK